MVIRKRIASYLVWLLFGIPSLRVLSFFPPVTCFLGGEKSVDVCVDDI